MRAPLRVALHAAEADRRRLLAELLGEAGHVLAAEDDAADVRLIDGAPRHLPGGADRAGSAVPSLLLTDHPAGVQDHEGVLPRTIAEPVLDAALRAIAAGLRVRSAARTAARGFTAVADDPPSGLLTPREMEILTAVGDGLSNKAVARRLGISAHTVKFHLEAVFNKLEVASRAEAVASGLRRGLIEL